MERIPSRVDRTDLREPDPSKRFFKEVYGAVNPNIRSQLIEKIGGNFGEHVRSVTDHGITKLMGLYHDAQIKQMQEDMNRWRQTKQWNKDNHMSFDGNSGENYLPTSEALSSAVTHPAILAVVTAAFGQHPRMNFIRTYSIDPIEPYERRAFQWHHDGYSEIGLKAMILLSDVSPEGQAMAFCPGTQLRDWDTKSSRETQFNKEYAESFKKYICSGDAGDVFIFNPHAVHRGQRNFTVRRDVVVANFQPGIARNYPLPGLHENVIRSLSKYGREVFRAGEDIFNIDESYSFLESLAAYRTLMDGLFAGLKLPEEVMRAATANVDNSIVAAGSANRTINPNVPKYVETLSPVDITKLRENIFTKCEGYANYLTTEEEDSGYTSSLRSKAHDGWKVDLNGDLDLPIRMYHPNRDQKRDNAITQTRDQEGAAHFTKLQKDIDGVTIDTLKNTNLSAFSLAANELVDNVEMYRSEIAELNDPALVGKLDSLFLLAEDLQEMLGRAYSVPLIRRTLLYTYLTWSRLQEFHDQYLGDRETNLKDVFDQCRTRAINLYVGFVGLDSLAHGQ